VNNWQEHVKLAAEVIGFITVVATIIAQVTPSNSDNIKADKFANAVFSFIRLLPTFGINPRTKELERALITYKIEKETDKGQDNNA